MTTKKSIVKISGQKYKKEAVESENSINVDHHY